MAARNVLRLIRNQERPAVKEEEALELYTPIPPGIKVSLGLVSRLPSIPHIILLIQLNPDEKRLPDQWSCWCQLQPERPSRRSECCRSLVLFRTERSEGGGYVGVILLEVEGLDAIYTFCFQLEL